MSIDIHTHILPGIDDGARDWEVSTAMARRAASDGISRLVATPHVMAGVYDTSRSRILELLDQLNRVLAQENILLEVLPGAEYYLDSYLLDLHHSGELLTINDQGRYILVEFPMELLPINYEQLLYSLQLEGLQPIIAHPERNRVFMNNISLLRDLHRRGMYMQVTAGSLCGYFGKTVKKTALNMVREGLVHVVASDAHSAGRRAPVLSPAEKELVRLFGNEAADLLLRENPHRIVKGMELKPLNEFPPKAFWRRILA